MQLLRELSPQPGSYYQMQVFEPLLRYPDVPAVAAGAEWMFSDPASLWHAILRSDSAIHFQDARFMLGRNPLLGLASFRKLVLQTLANTQVVETLKADSTETYEGDPLCPPPGSSVAVRRCEILPGTCPRSRACPAASCSGPRAHQRWPGAFQ